MNDYTLCRTEKLAQAVSYSSVFPFEFERPFTHASRSPVLDRDTLHQHHQRTAGCDDALTATPDASDASADPFDDPRVIEVSGHARIERRDADSVPCARQNG